MTPTLRDCGFCDKPEDGTSYFIHGGKCAICAECIQLASTVVRKRTGRPAGVHEGECWVPIANGEHVAFADANTEPEGAPYVRLVDSRGAEVLYYDAAEFRGDPSATLGALMGAMLHGAGWEEYPGRHQQL